MRKIEGNLVGKVIKFYTDEEKYPINGIILEEKGKSIKALCGSDYHWKDLSSPDLYDWGNLDERIIIAEDIEWIDSEEVSKIFLKIICSVKLRKSGGWESYFEVSKINQEKVKKALSLIKGEAKFVETESAIDYSKVLVVWDEKIEEKVIDPSQETHTKGQLDNLIRRLLKEDKVMPSSIKVYYWTERQRISYQLK